MVAAILVAVVGIGGIGALRLAAGTPAIVERSQAAEETPEAQTSPQTEQAQQEASSAAVGQKPAGIVVHVDGAVAAPGVYVLLQDAPRINDAVQKAGGLTQEADTSGLNLAAPLEDGQKVHVPAIGEQTMPLPDEGIDSPATTGATNTPSLVNINSATEAELQSLPGVGEATASAIVQDRQNLGEFSSIEDIMRVSGIGEKKFSKIKELICV